MADVIILNLFLFSCEKASPVYNVLCLYGLAEKVQNEATILMARRKFIY